MKKYRWNILFILVLSIVILGYLVGKESPMTLLMHFQSLAPMWIIMGFVCIGVYVGIESVIQYLLTRKMQKGNSLWNAFKVVMTGQFFNAITPFASGGQPMQVVVMASQGVPIGTSISILMAKFIMYQLILTIYSFIVLIIEMKFFVTKVSGMIYLSLIGFLLNLGIVIVLITCAFMKQRLKRSGCGLINIIYKLKLIKSPIGAKRKLIKQVDLFNDNISIFKKNRQLLIQVGFLTVLQLTAYFLIPYAVYKAFGLQGTRMFLIISAAAFIVMISSFIPIPGGSGVAEGSFFLLFQLFFPDTILPTAVLCWRLITFYIPLCLGAVMTVLPNRGIKGMGKTIRPNPS